MASIQKRGSTYRVQVMVRGKRRSKSFATKKVAAAWGAKMEGDKRYADAYTDAKAQRRTLGDAIDGWMEDYSGRDTIVQSRAAWWKQEYGDYRLHELDRATLNEARRKLQDKEAVRYAGKDKVVSLGHKLSPATINRYLQALSSALSWAVEEGWLHESPMRQIKRKQEPRGRVRYLSDEERARLLDACDNSEWPGLGLMVRLALSTGARKGELTNLKWSDVDLAAGRALLHTSKNEDRRSLPLVPPVVGRLKAWAKVRRIDTELVFPSSRKDTTQPFAFDPYFRKAVRDAGIEDFRFHDLRHSAASYLAMNGASMLEIADVLGHKTLAMVKRYSHLSDQHKQKLVSRVMTDLV